MSHRLREIVRIHPSDNVGIALRDLAAGESVAVGDQYVTLRQSVPKGHKMALQAIPAQAHILKYGLPIGYAIQDIAQGDYVHVQNVRTNLSDVNNYQYHPLSHQATFDAADQFADQTVQLYRRANGEVGIRNELWIIPTVTCISGVSEQIRQRFLAELGSQRFFDEVVVLKHPYGCSQLGQDHENTRTILQNLVGHPNAGAVLVVGLGCENNQVDAFKETMGNFDFSRVRFLVAQQAQDEIAEGAAYLHQLHEQMREDKREAGHLSELRIGLECGGSDGFSGITANPLLGRFSDYLTYYGGTTVLTEVPEMFGAENLLMDRCVDQHVFEKTVQMINDFKQYFLDHHQPIYENPSPGNKAGGITTLEDKSLGCTQKSGQASIVDVLRYGDRLSQSGLNLLSAPGNDAVATGALAAAGCHLVLFTTGRGTPYGGVVPTVKIATHSALAQRKPNWIDFNAGSLIEGISMDELLQQFIDALVAIVNGKPTCNEVNGFRDLSILKGGVTL